MSLLDKKNREKPRFRWGAIRKFKKGYEEKGGVESGEYGTEKEEHYFTGGFLKRGKVVSKYDDADNPVFPKGIKKRNLGKYWK